MAPRHGPRMLKKNIQEVHSHYRDQKVEKNIQEVGKGVILPTQHDAAHHLEYAKVPRTKVLLADPSMRCLPAEPHFERPVTYTKFWKRTKRDGRERSVFTVLQFYCR